MANEEVTQEEVQEEPVQEQEATQQELPFDDKPLVDPDVEQAKELLAALRSPNASTVIKKLANQYGMTAQETSEIQEQVDDTEQDSVVKQILKKHLGKELPVVSVKLADAIEEVISNRVDPMVTNIHANTQERDIAVAARNLVKKYNLQGKQGQKVLHDMNELSKKIVSNGNMSIPEYLESLYAVVASKGTVASRVKQVQKINNNLQDSGNIPTSANRSKNKQSEPTSIREVLYNVLKNSKENELYLN